MVPKIAAKGKSFKGAGLYYLHDKGADSKERVAFTHTENLPTNSPDKAVACMARTAMHQNEIKARAGGSAKGRKLEYPVYTYSLAWHPDQEPTRAQMIEAAQETLKVLALDEHEALFVAHNDEPHPHIHIIVNRVHPETGIAAKLSKDRLKLSAWAENYERRFGQILCEQRVENNRRRGNKEFVKDRNNAPYERRKRTELARFERRLAAEKALDDRQRKRRRDLYIAKEELIHKERASSRDEHRRFWRALYLHQQQEREKLAFEQHQRMEDLKELLGKPGGVVLREDDARRRGKLSGYFKDVSTPSRLPDAKQVAARESRNRRKAERGRADELKKTLKDGKAIHRLDGDRTGRLSGHFGDKADPLPARRHRMSDPFLRYAQLQSETEKLNARHAKERKELGRKIAEKQRIAFEAINRLYQEQLEAMTKVEQRERDRLEKTETGKAMREDFGHAADEGKQHPEQERRDGKDGIGKDDRSDEYRAFREMRDGGKGDEGKHKGGKELGGPGSDRD